MEKFSVFYSTRKLDEIIFVQLCKAYDTGYFEDNFFSIFEIQYFSIFLFCEEMEKSMSPRKGDQYKCNDGKGWKCAIFHWFMEKFIFIGAFRKVADERHLVESFCECFEFYWFLSLVAFSKFKFRKLVFQFEFFFWAFFWLKISEIIL